MPPAIAGWALALIGLFNIVGSLSMGWAVGRWRMKSLLSLLYATRGLAVLAFVLAPKTPAVALTLCAAVIWIFWFAKLTGWPAQAAKNALRLVPGFTPEVGAVALPVAAIATAGWFALVHWRVARRPAVLWRAVVLSSGGLILIWILLMTLFLPDVNYSTDGRREMRQYTSTNQPAVAASATRKAIQPSSGVKPGTSLSAFLAARAGQPVSLAIQKIQITAAHKVSAITENQSMALMAPRFMVSRPKAAITASGGSSGSSWPCSGAGWNSVSSRPMTTKASGTTMCSTPRWRRDAGQGAAEARAAAQPHLDKDDTG